MLFWAALMVAISAICATLVLWVLLYKLWPAKMWAAQNQIACCVYYYEDASCEHIGRADIGALDTASIASE